MPVNEDGVDISNCGCPGRQPSEVERGHVRLTGIHSNQEEREGFELLELEICHDLIFDFLPGNGHKVHLDLEG